MRQSASSRHQGLNPGQSSSRGQALAGGKVIGKKLKTEYGNLAYDGPNPIVCPECGVGLDPRRKAVGQSVPRHSRFGHGVSIRGDKPLCRGAVPDKEKEPEHFGQLVVVSPRYARSNRLVTREMIRTKYGFETPDELNLLIRRMPAFPKAIAKLEAPGVPVLYEADKVLKFFSRWKEGGERR